jgi:hypothetical protein
MAGWMMVASKPNGISGSQSLRVSHTDHSLQRLRVRVPHDGHRAEDSPRTTCAAGAAPEAPMPTHLQVWQSRPFGRSLAQNPPSSRARRICPEEIGGTVCSRMLISDLSRGVQSRETETPSRHTPPTLHVSRLCLTITSIFQSWDASTTHTAARHGQANPPIPRIVGK